MKILIIGADSPYAIEKHYLKHMLAKVEVKLFPVQNMFLEYYYKSLLNKIVFRSGFSSIYKKINQELISEIKLFKPDIAFVFKGMEVLPTTLKWCRENNIKLVNYNPDNPFIFSGRGSGNKNVTKSIGLYDLHLTYDQSVKERIQKEFKIKAEIVPFGFEVDELLFEKCILQNEVIKVCFVGTPDKERAQFLKKLAEADIRIDVYGYNWAKYLQHKNIEIFKTVYGDDFWLTLRKYRIQLNLMRPHNPSSHNMRSFEVPGIGGVLLAPSTEDHKNFFLPDQEIFLFKDLKSCIEKIKYLINLPLNEADKIRHQARTRSIGSGYAYKDRALKVLEYFNELILEKN